jgi:citrate synthase
LCHELIGKLSFSEMAYFLILGRRPTAAECKLVDACLVALMEHGMTPSAISARLVYSSAPEAMQAAVASGLLGVGGVFAGTMEGCGALLSRMLDSTQDLEAIARQIAEEHRATKKPMPGFGHPQHKPDDPRALALLRLAQDEGVAGRHVAALEALARAVDEVNAKHVTINVTGAIAAILGDAGVPHGILRGFALISRCAGLVAHVHEEQQKPALGAIWNATERAVTYDGGK